MLLAQFFDLKLPEVEEIYGAVAGDWIVTEYDQINYALGFMVSQELLEDSCYGDSIHYLTRGVPMFRMNGGDIPGVPPEEFDAGAPAELDEDDLDEDEDEEEDGEGNEAGFKDDEWDDEDEDED